MLDGERLSYRALDVEQIGSVYESMMGFEVERATGPSVGVRRRKKGMNLDIVFNVKELLDVDPGKRKKWLKDATECDLTGKPATELKNADTPEDVVAVLGKKISPRISARAGEWSRSRSGMTRITRTFEVTSSPRKPSPRVTPRRKLPSP